jgi:hypothetical protein
MGISVPKLRKYTNPRVVSLMLKMLSIFFRDIFYLAN